MLNASIRQMRYFLTLADTLNFSRAASKVGVTQSTLSTAIQGLEEEIGALLFDRTGRSVALTQAGAGLLPHVHEIVDAVDDLPNIVAEAGKPLAQRLKLGIIPSIAPFVLPRALPSLKDAFPELRLTLREGLTRNLLAELRGDQLDAAIIAMPYALDGIEFALIGTDPLLLAVGATHRLAHATEISSTDLKLDHLLLLDEGHCLRDHVIAALDLTPPRESDDIRATSLTTLVQMVDNNMGVTLLPSLAVEAGVTRGTHIVIRAFDSPKAVRQIALIWKEKSIRRADFLALAEHLRQDLKAKLSDTG